MRSWDTRCAPRLEGVPELTSLRQLACASSLSNVSLQNGAPLLMRLQSYDNIPRCLQVPDALWEAAACMPALAELSISVHTPAETVVAVGSHVWQRLAACTQLARLKLAEGFVDGAPDESGKIAKLPSYGLALPSACRSSCISRARYSGACTQPRLHSHASETASPQPATAAPPPCAGAFELHPGITQLTALRRFGLHGNIASLGDLWHHTGLTRLMLLDSEQPIPAPAHRGPSLPALLEADLGADNWQMEPPQHGVISQGLRNVTRLVRPSCGYQQSYSSSCLPQFR